MIVQRSVLYLSIAIAGCVARPVVSDDSADAGLDPTNEDAMDAGGPRQEPKEKGPKPDGGPKDGPKADKDGGKKAEAGPDANASSPPPPSP